MYKYIVIARRPEKRTLMWDYPDGFFPRRVFYKSDADRIAASARRKGGEAVNVEPYTEARFAIAKRNK